MTTPTQPMPELLPCLDEFTKATYFNVIYHFGLMTDTNTPSASKQKPFRILVKLKGHGQVTCYGETVEKVCALALEWLEQRDLEWFRERPDPQW